MAPPGDAGVTSHGRVNLEMLTMMKLTTTILAGIAVSAAVLASAAPATAEGPYRGPHYNYKKWGYGPYYRPGPYYYGPRVYYRPPPGYYYGPGDALAAGALGLAAGAIIGGAIAEGSNRPGSYNNPLPAPAAPSPGGYGYPAAPAPAPAAASAEPWSDGWYRHCAATYKSFDPTKGTYRGYDGRDHFCVVR